MCVCTCGRVCAKRRIFNTPCQENSEYIIYSSLKKTTYPGKQELSHSKEEHEEPYCEVYFKYNKLFSTVSIINLLSIIVLSVSWAKVISMGEAELEIVLGITI